MRYKQVIVILQVVILAIAFFIISGLFASILYLLGEVSWAEVVTYCEILAGSESVSTPIFLEGLFYYTFKKNRRKHD